MSYRDFSLDSLQQTFGLTAARKPLFPTVKPVEVTAWLLETLRRGKDAAVFSEKARGEFIVAPVLLTCRELLNEEFSIYSGVRLDVDPARQLVGECDFILARRPPLPVVQAPLMVILEAKKNDIEEGLGQCAAQLLGARLFNERRQESINPLHGCVTTGETWQFLQLNESQILIDTERYFINEVGKILGILTSIMRTPPSEQASDAA